MTDVVRVRAAEFHEFFGAAFSKLACPPSIAEPTAHALVEASLRGVDSHGVRLAPHYLAAAVSGRINLTPVMTCERTSATTALWNADHTYGTAAASEAMKQSIEMATESGMGCTAVGNSSHFGAAAIYALMAAEQGMIGLSLTHSDALVAPFGAATRYLGTNPICIAAPCEGEDPFCLDMATSAISWNRLLMHRSSGEPLDDGWALDAEGRPCRDAGLSPTLTPSGGYKGSGLAMAVEILCSLLTAMPFGPHIPRMFPVTGERRHLGHVVAAIDIRRFQPLDAFKARLRQMLDEIRALPPAPGCRGVLAAGDPEKAQRKERLEHGIPVSLRDLDAFRQTAQTLGLDHLF